MHVEVCFHSDNHNQVLGEVCSLNTEVPLDLALAKEGSTSVTLTLNRPGLVINFPKCQFSHL